MNEGGNWYKNHKIPLFWLLGILSLLCTVIFISWNINASGIKLFNNLLSQNPEILFEELCKLLTFWQPIIHFKPKLSCAVASHYLIHFSQVSSSKCPPSPPQCSSSVLSKWPVARDHLATDHITSEFAEMVGVEWCGGRNLK